jgi:hypothetical protein
MLNLKCGNDSATERGRVESCNRTSAENNHKRVEYEISNVVCQGYDIGCHFQCISILISKSEFIVYFSLLKRHECLPFAQRRHEKYIGSDNVKHHSQIRGYVASVFE